LIVEGHLTRGQRLENVSYVNLWAACDTYMKFRKAKINQLLHKLKDMVAR
jgi:hypothetical protein